MRRSRAGLLTAAESSLAAAADEHGGEWIGVVDKDLDLAIKVRKY